MCGGSWSITGFCWFLHILIWSNIGEGFNEFYKFSFLVTRWVNVYGARDIPCHIWEQGNQVLLVYLCSHWSAWWDIEDHSEFGKWFSWGHRPSYWIILHLIYQFFIYSPITGVAMKSVYSKYASTWNGDCWNFTSSFVFVTQYSWMIFFMMWSVCSILIPYLILIMLMLMSFICGPSWKL